MHRYQCIFRATQKRSSPTDALAVSLVHTTATPPATTLNINSSLHGTRDSACGTEAAGDDSLLGLADFPGLSFLLGEAFAWGFLSDSELVEVLCWCPLAWPLDLSEMMKRRKENVTIGWNTGKLVNCVPFCCHSFTSLMCGSIYIYIIYIIIYLKKLFHMF